MTLETYQRKQIVYPGIFTRIVTILLDLTFLSLFINIPMQYIGLYLFKLNFGDFAVTYNLPLQSQVDIANLISKEEFKEYLSSFKYLTYFGELLFAQFLLMAAYFIFCWTKYGTTFAKFLFKHKVMDYKTHTKPKLYQSIIRYFSYLFFPISLIIGTFTKERRALHDIFAGTVVIKV